MEDASERSTRDFRRLRTLRAERCADAAVGAVTTFAPTPCAASGGASIVEAEQSAEARASYDAAFEAAHPDLIQQREQQLAACGRRQTTLGEIPETP